MQRGRDLINLRESRISTVALYVSCAAAIQSHGHLLPLSLDSYHLFVRFALSCARVNTR